MAEEIDVAAAIQRVRQKVSSLPSDKKKEGNDAILLLKIMLGLDIQGTPQSTEGISLDAAIMVVQQAAETPVKAEDLEKAYKAVNTLKELIQLAPKAQPKAEPLRSVAEPAKGRRFFARTLVGAVASVTLAGVRSDQVASAVIADRSPPDDGIVNEDSILVQKHSTVMQYILENLQAHLADRKMFPGEAEHKNPESRTVGGVFAHAEILFNIVKKLRPRRDPGRLYENSELRAFMPLLRQAVEEGAGSLVVEIAKAYPQFKSDGLIEPGPESKARPGFYSLPDYVMSSYANRGKPDMLQKDVLAAIGQSRGR